MLAMYLISTSESAVNLSSHAPRSFCASPQDFCQEILLNPPPRIWLLIFEVCETSKVLYIIKAVKPFAVKGAFSDGAQ